MGLNALPFVAQSAEKRRNSKDSEASTRSGTPEASDATESIDSMSDVGSLRPLHLGNSDGASTSMFESSRPASVRSKTPRGVPSPPGSAQSTSARSTSPSIHTFRKVSSHENSSNKRSPLLPSTPPS